MQDKQHFLEKYGITEKYNQLEKITPQLWEQLTEIREHYVRQKNLLESIQQGFIKDIGSSEYIHSIRFRIKDSDSLIVKIIEKKFENFKRKSKYNNITADNYYKILTDLIGVRIIIRYRYQWQKIHELVWDKFHNSDREYLSDYEKDYSQAREIFIAEKPIVYYRHGEDKKNYEMFGRDIFEIKLSEIGYSSIHYIINYNGSYIELQVRTIYDEAWSECDHDFVYKLNASPKKLVLKRCSRMLSDITGVADGLSSFIRDYHTDEIYKVEKKETSEQAAVLKRDMDEESADYRAKRLSIDVERVSDILDIF